MFEDRVDVSAIEFTLVTRTQYSTKIPHVINFNAAPDPQGRLSGLSKVFPNKMSFAEYGFKNLPGYHDSQC